jgi:hypothetical protein
MTQSFSGALYALFSIAFITIVSGLVSLPSIGLQRRFRCKPIPYVSWCMLSFFIACFSLIIAGIFAMFLFAGSDFCQVLPQYIGKESYYDSFVSLIKPDLSEKLKICVFGNGDFSQQFGIFNEINTINNISLGIAQLKAISGLFAIY